MVDLLGLVVGRAGVRDDRQRRVQRVEHGLVGGQHLARLLEDGPGEVGESRPDVEGEAVEPGRGLVAELRPGQVGAGGEVPGDVELRLDLRQVGLEARLRHGPQLQVDVGVVRGGRGGQGGAAQLAGAVQVGGERAAEARGRVGQVHDLHRQQADGAGDGRGGRVRQARVDGQIRFAGRRGVDVELAAVVDAELQVGQFEAQAHGDIVVRRDQQRHGGQGEAEVGGQVGGRLAGRVLLDVHGFDLDLHVAGLEALEAHGRPADRAAGRRAEGAEPPGNSVEHVEGPGVPARPAPAATAAAAAGPPTCQLRRGRRVSARRGILSESAVTA
jgi:hypothetical protein